MQYFYNCYPVTLTGQLINNTINAVDYDANGGAIMIKGTEITFENATINNNKAVAKGPNTLAAGGAIYADAAINENLHSVVTAVIKATEDKTISGNTIMAYEGDENKWYDTYGGLAQSSGGFLFLDRDAIAKIDVAKGATLTIGEANSEDVHADSIASALMHGSNLKGAQLIKLGDGKVVINGDMNKYYGSLNVEAGEMALTKDITFTNTVNVGFEGKAAVLTLGNATVDSLSHVLNKEAVDGKITIEAQVAKKHESATNYTVNEQKGLLYVNDDAVVNAQTLTVKDGTVELQGGTLNVGQYTGTLEVTDPNSALNTDTVKGRINVTGGSSLAIGTLNNDNLVLDATGAATRVLFTEASGQYIPQVTITAADTVKLLNDSDDSYMARINGGQVTINAKKLEQKGSGHGIYVCDTNEGKTSLDINVDEYDVESKYSAIHLRDGNGDGVVNLNAKTITAKATTKEDGVALFQVNEKNTMNITADKASLTGSNTSSGGVLGSGGPGTINLNVAQELTIDGNICGTYSKMLGDAFANDKLAINVTAGKLAMTGHINAGSIKQSGIDNAAVKDILPLDATNDDPAGWSNFSRSTEVNIEAAETAFNGTINAFNKGTINAALGKATFAEGAKVRAYANGKVNLSGDIAFNNTELAGTDTGAVNLAAGQMSGTIAVNGANVNLTGAEFAAAEGLSNITGSQKLNLTDLGVLKASAGDIFTVADAASEADNAVNDTAKGKVTFTAGSVALTDEGYTLAYVENAKAALIAADAVADDKKNTSLVMLGMLKSGEELSDTETVEQLATVGSGVEFDQITGTTNGNNLIIGNGVSDAETTVIKQGFSAKDLEMGDGHSVLIKDSQSLTLGGSEGGALVEADGPVAFTVGNGTEAGGSLVVGNSLATADTEYTLNGSIKANMGEIIVNGNLTVTEGMALENGALNAAGSVNTETLSFTGDNAIVGNVAVSDTLTGAADAVLNVGNEEESGNISIAKADLNGGMMFIDPAWKDGVGIDGASNVAIGSPTTLDGHYVVGQNAVLAFGTTENSDAVAAFAETGLTWGPEAITAAAYLKENIDVTSGSLVVDGSLTSAPTASTNGTVNAAANSLLIVDGSKVNNGTDAAISGAAAITVADSAKLYVQNAKKGETYNIFAGATADTYADENVLSSNALIKFAENNGSVTASYKGVKEALGEDVLLENIIDSTLEDGSEGDVVYDFINTAVDDSANATAAAKVQALNSLANMGELAGLSHSTYTVSNMVTDAIGAHEPKKGQVWAEYIHNKENVAGQGLAAMTGAYDGSYNGIVVGADLYAKGKVNAGVALSYADGKITGASKNDATYYGMSLYGNMAQGDTTVKADITYLHGDNELSQVNSGSLLTAKADSDAFSIGVKAEHKLGGGFTPYVGARYLHLGAGNYTNSLGMTYNVEDQSLLLLPVGVNYTMSVKRGDWTFKPVVEAGYVWNLGDKATDLTVSLDGISDSFGYQVVDNGSFISRFAIEAERANIRYGLGYQYQKSDSSKHNRWTANVSLSF